MAEKVVIIGSGPAGWTAAVYAGRADLNPLVIEGAVTEENRVNNVLPLGQLNLTTEVENFPSWPYGDTREYLKTALPEEDWPYWVSANKKQPTHGINGPELMALMRKQARQCGAKVLTDDVVSANLGRRPFVLTTLGGQTVEAESIILATGARANYLGLPSENRFKNVGVSACAVCDGALPRFRNKPLVVVGGGDTACEEASFLAKYASKVFLVHRRAELRASMAMQDRVLKDLKDKITPLWNRQVDEVLGSDEAGVTGVRLKGTADGKTEVVEAAGMFLGIGHTPNIGFLKGQVELTPTGYIKWTAPPTTRTSVPGVFAAGDVADEHYKQAVTAAGSGCAAALDAERWLAHAH